MTKIVNGRIVSDSDTTEEAGDNSWTGGVMGSTSSSSNSVRLCGRDFSSWSIGGCLAISFLFSGFRGVFFVVVLLGIAYCLEKRGGGSGSNTFGYSSLSTGSSSSAQAPQRGRSNIKGIGDLPKPAAKC
jgi:hypothetical protein